MLSRLNTASIIALVLAAVFGRLSTAMAQIVAGIYLKPEEFGIYATAVGVVLATTGLRGGGTGNHLQTMTTDEFRKSGWRVFRYAQIFTVLGFGATLIAAWPVAQRFSVAKNYPSAALLETILLLGFNFVLFNTSWYGRCKMIAMGEVRTIAAFDAAMGFTKFASTWLLAASGFGPLALAGALTIGGLLENAWVWRRTGLASVARTERTPWLMRTIREMRLPLVMAILTTLGSQTDAMVGSLFLPVTVIGFYFFAMQLASQPTMLVGTTIRAVFTSASASVRGDTDRERQSLQIIFNGAMVFLPIVTMSIPAVFEPFEVAVWGGRWADSRWPVLILSIAAIYSTALQLAAAPVAGIRKWKVAIRLDFLRAVSKIVGAMIGGVIVIWLQLDAIMAGITLAAAVGGATAIVSAAELYRLLTTSGISRSTTLYELYSTPLAAILSAIASSGLAHSLTEPLRISLGLRAGATVECLVAGLVYIVLSFLLLRFGYTPTLERLLQAVPAPIARPLRRVFLMPAV